MDLRLSRNLSRALFRKIRGPLVLPQGVLNNPLSDRVPPWRLSTGPHHQHRRSILRLSKLRFMTWPRQTPHVSPAPHPLSQHKQPLNPSQALLTTIRQALDLRIGPGETARSQTLVGSHQEHVHPSQARKDTAASRWLVTSLLLPLLRHCRTHV
jgi:hypothetical protein